MPKAKMKRKGAPASAIADLASSVLPVRFETNIRNKQTKITRQGSAIADLTASHLPVRF